METKKQLEITEYRAKFPLLPDMASFNGSSHGIICEKATLSEEFED